MSSFQTRRQVQAILARFPELAHDASFWMTVVNSGLASVDLLADEASTEILENKQVMLAACQKDYRVYDVLCAPLNQEVDWVEAALGQTPDALCYIPAFVQRLYPELVANSIRQASPHRNAAWFEYVGEELWSSNRQVTLAWLSIGGEYLQDKFPFHFRDDEELMLLVAEHNWSEFGFASERLRSNKLYMLQAVTRNGVLIFDAVGELGRDFDLAMIAFSNTTDLIESYDEDDTGNVHFLHSFERHVQEKLQEHANFLLFLGGISRACSDEEPPGTVVSLPLLNQGQETSLIYKRLVQEYLGVAIGPELERLRVVYSNLRR